MSIAIGNAVKNRNIEGVRHWIKYIRDSIRKPGMEKAVPQLKALLQSIHKADPILPLLPDIDMHVLSEIKQLFFSLRLFMM